MTPSPSFFAALRRLNRTTNLTQTQISFRAHLKRTFTGLSLALFALTAHVAVFAQQTYKQPPKEILDVLNAPVTPQASISPARDYMMLFEGVRYPPITDLAQPLERLAGLRIATNSNGPYRAPYFVSLALKRINDGTETRIGLPAGAHISAPQWSPDGKRFAFTNAVANHIELWVGEVATAKARRIEGVTINAAYGEPLQWMPDNQTLLVQLVPANRKTPPTAATAPAGPNAQESTGKRGPVRTYEDLLKTPHDEDLFDYYATSQLAFLNVANNQTTPVGQPAIFQTLDASPDGNHLLVARLHRPYSYLYPHFAFPKDVEVWDRAAKVVYKLASLPLADEVPVDGVPKGAREYEWRPTEPATLVWAEALDNGDPKQKVPFRDRLLMLKAPFTAAPVELAKTEQRFGNLQWSEKGGTAFFSDYNRDTRHLRTYLIDANDPAKPAKLVWDLSTQDRYRNPGTPVTRVLPTGHRAMLQSGDFIYLNGQQGASPQGDRPFLDRFNLQTLQAERLFRSDGKSFESVVALLSDDGTRFITRRETPVDPPNYFIRSLAPQTIAATTPGEAVRASDFKPLTQFPDPTPQLRGIKKQLVTYKRKDGVDLSFTLYLPPNYKEGTRLPTIVWAYPAEFNDPATAGQVSGSTQRYTTITGPSQLFLLLEGYAILDNASIPIVGEPETVNNTYLEQLVSSAQAAIDKAVEMGVADRDRVGVGGHSYGAFMTANLLAHSDLFRAGVARSGAYNRTLTPFGFQSERRSLWEAPELYMKISPFNFANKINEPLLLIHGEADDNTGTFPIQSDRMYQAIRGTGGTVRLVTLPLEAHGYAARESIGHVLYETINWFDKYVKNAPPRTGKEQQAGR
ncbi:MAG: prolyl oligopeptidase family serine peptidase [Pyrinomonadaceae bacterium]